MDCWSWPPEIKPNNTIPNARRHVCPAPCGGRTDQRCAKSGSKSMSAPRVDSGRRRDGNSLGGCVNRQAFIWNAMLPTCTTYVIVERDVATLQGPAPKTSADWTLSSNPSSPHPGMDMAARATGWGLCRTATTAGLVTGSEGFRSQDILPLCSFLSTLFVSTPRWA